MNALANTKLEKLLAEARVRAAAIVEAKRYQRVTYLPILPGEPVGETTAENTSGRWLAIVHDLSGLGPAGFHQPSLQRLTSGASHLVMVTEVVDPAVYRLFAVTAATIGHVLVVETTPPLYAAWKRFLSEHSVQAPLLVVKGGQP